MPELAGSTTPGASLSASSDNLRSDDICKLCARGHLIKCIQLNLSLKVKLFRLTQSKKFPTLSRIPTLLAGLSLAAAPVSAATFDVTQVPWGDATTANSLAWAIHQANITPGFDTIRLFNDVSVDAATVYEPATGFLTEMTDTSGLRIQGNGHALAGNPGFLTINGNYIGKDIPSRNFNLNAGDQLLAPSYSFARIADNVFDVSIDGMVFDGLNAVLDIGRNSLVSITNSTFQKLVPFGYMARSAIFAAEGSTVNLTEVLMNKLSAFPNSTFGAEYIWEVPAISGISATLNAYKTTFDLYGTSQVAGAVSWAGGIANIVSSTITGPSLDISGVRNSAGGIDTGVLNLVNSIVRPAGSTSYARIQAFAGGVANVIASTIQFDAINSTIPSSQFCPNLYPCNGAPLQAFSNGAIHLQSSAVSVLNEAFPGIQFPYSDSYDPQTGAPIAGVLTADQYSYVQPVTNQNAANLEILFQQPSLITAGVAYTLDPNSNPPFDAYFDLPGGASPNPSGPLIGVVPNADALNQLINPIDGSVISTDVYGNPRTSNGQRDVGAVQTAVPGPLPLLGCGAAFGWSRRLRQRIRRGAGHGESRTAG